MVAAQMNWICPFSESLNKGWGVSGDTESLDGSFYIQRVIILADGSSRRILLKTDNRRFTGITNDFFCPCLVVGVSEMSSGKFEPDQVLEAVYYDLNMDRRLMTLSVEEERSIPSISRFTSLGPPESNSKDISLPNGFPVEIPMWRVTNLARELNSSATLGMTQIESLRMLDIDLISVLESMEGQSVEC